MYRESETQTNPYTPDYVLPPDAPAMFRVTLKNELSYYPAGPASKWREGWMGTDTGYVAPDMQFGTDPYSLHGGLLVMGARRALRERTARAAGSTAVGHNPRTRRASPCTLTRMQEM